MPEPLLAPALVSDNSSRPTFKFAALLDSLQQHAPSTLHPRLDAGYAQAQPLRDLLVPQSIQLRQLHGLPIDFRQFRDQWQHACGHFSDEVFLF